MAQRRKPDQNLLHSTRAGGSCHGQGTIARTRRRPSARTLHVASRTCDTQAQHHPLRGRAPRATGQHLDGMKPPNPVSASANAADHQWREGGTPLRCLGDVRVSLLHHQQRVYPTGPIRWATCPDSSCQAHTSKKQGTGLWICGQVQECAQTTPESIIVNCGPTLA